MINLITIASFVTLSMLFSGCQNEPAVEPADIIMINGGVYTVDAERSWSEAAAIRDGEIIAVGSNELIAQYDGRDTEVIDLTGAMAMPGFHDAHVHPLEGGYLIRYCDLSEIESSQDAVRAKIRQCVLESDDEWVIGFGIDLALFGQDGPDNAFLNETAADRYVFIDAVDGHSALVNDRLLALANISAETPDPEKGVIERRPGTKIPSGTLRESARDLVDQLRPKRAVATSINPMRDAMKKMNSVGITSAVDAWAGELEMKVWKSLDDSGELTLRVVNSIIDEGVFQKHEGDDFERVLAMRKQYSSDLINNESIKIMVDGVLEGETAALVEPYLDLGHSGTLNHSIEELRERVSRYVGMGLQVHMHAMGDGAARAGLDAIEFANEQHAEKPATADLRHHLSHLVLIHDDDIARFGDLGVTANFTAAWAHPSTWVTELNVPVVGENRVGRFYPIRSVKENGGLVVGGSDWIYGPVDPLESIEVAITRQDPFDDSAATGNVDDAVDLETAIDMYTINAAWLMHQEDKTGSIEVGKRADIVVLDQNLFEIPATQINNAKVRVTIFDGKIIYKDQ